MLNGTALGVNSAQLKIDQKDAYLTLRIPIEKNINDLELEVNDEAEEDQHVTFTGKDIKDETEKDN